MFPPFALDDYSHPAKPSPVSDPPFPPGGFKGRDFPHQCPTCRSPAYIGLNRIDCSDLRCPRHPGNPHLSFNLPVD